MKLIKPMLMTKLMNLTLAGVFLFALPASALMPNDPFFNQQWHLQKISAPSAWDVTTGGETVVVAVLDTGVDLDHPDLAGNIWTNPGETAGDNVDNDGNGYVDDIHGWNFIENGPDTNPQATRGASLEALNHGTIIAGIIGAMGNNGGGVSGVGWNVKIMPIRVLTSIGNGSEENVIAGIDYAVDNGAHIINLSFTTAAVTPDFESAIRRAHDAGVLVVAAIGNDELLGGIDTDKEPLYPACLDGPAGQNWVVGVAATGRDDRRAGFSNFGARCVDLSAPGVGIFSTQRASAAAAPSEFYGGGWSGSSLSAPIVAGVAALVKSMSPYLTRNDIVDVLLKSADSIDPLNPDFRGKLGRGRINAALAVDNARAALAKRTSIPTIAVSSDTNGPSRVWLFNGVGTLISAFLAYDQAFRGGVRLASYDFDGDGKREIVTAPGSGGGPHIKIWNTDGRLLNDFFAFDADYRAGVTVAAADIDGDGQGEIIAGAGRDADPVVRIFNRWGRLKSEFLAFPREFRGGVEVSAGDVDDNGVLDVLVGAQGQGAPQVRAFDNRGILKGQFFAFEETYMNGVRIGAVDVGGLPGDEILAARGGGESVLLHQFRLNAPWNTIVTFVGDRDGPLAITARKERGRKAEIFVAGGRKGEFPVVHGFNPIGALLSAFPVPQELGVSLRIAAL